MKYILPIFMAALLFCGFVYADDEYIVDKLYGEDITGEISGDIISGSRMTPIPFIQWELDDNTVLIPLGFIPNDYSYVIGTTLLGGYGFNSYWGDAACIQYLAITMFEKGNTAFRQTTATSTNNYTIYLIDDGGLADTTNYYTVDSNNVCKGPYISEVPLNLAIVTGTLKTLTGPYEFIITEADDSPIAPIDTK